MSTMHILALLGQTYNRLEVYAGVLPAFYGICMLSCIIICEMLMPFFGLL